jgi:hypothetical protein
VLLVYIDATMRFFMLGIVLSPPLSGSESNLEGGVNSNLGFFGKCTLANCHMAVSQLQDLAAFKGI